jgi:hypothetical protein
LIEQATYIWLGPSGFGSTAQNPKRVNIQLQDSGVYQMIAVVGGCSSRAAQTLVRVQPCEPINCPQPFNITLSQVTSSEATVAWQTPLPGGICNIVSYGPLASNPDDWTLLLAPAGMNSMLITGLNPSTQYGVRVRTNCSVCSIRNGQLSPWSAVSAFATLSARLQGQLENQNHDIALRAYPNPTSGIFYLAAEKLSGDSMEVKVFDLAGKMVDQMYLDWSQSAGQASMDITHLPSGIYLLQVSDSQKLSTFKFKIIKQ